MKSAVFGALVLVAFVVGCKSDNATISTVAPPTTASGTISHLDQQGGSPFIHTQNLTGTADLFFVFTNPGTSTASGTFSAQSANQVTTESPQPQRSLSGLLSGDLRQFAREQGLGLRGLPEITEFNSKPQVSGQTGPRRQITPPRLAVVGDSQTFYGMSSTDTISATLKSQTTDGSLTLNVWVANDAWSGCSKAHCMTQTMVDQFAAKFVQSGDSNDIYDWVTNLYGVPWGSHSYSNLIGSTSANTIDILFYDIDADNSDTGGILGFFYSKDNYLSSSVSFSNERLMFYADSVLTAKADGTTWEVTDAWPAEMISTLAHEFQHMIHFYQKNTLKSVVSSNTDAWIEELMSMMTEDLVAEKIGVNGPRGVSGSDGTAGSYAANDQSSRPAWFNHYPYLSQAYWANDSAVYYRYAINYAFGAYLSRNYGGAVLAAALMDAEGDDRDTVVEAVNAQGYDLTYADLLERFHTAVLLSSTTGVEAGYKFNEGAFFTSTLNGIDYNLGSVNFYLYGSGPATFTSSNLSSSVHSLSASAGVLVQVGSDVSGTQNYDVEMPVGAQLTVVERP